MFECRGECPDFPPDWRSHRGNRGVPDQVCRETPQFGRAIDNVLKKIFKKTDGLTDAIGDAGTSAAKRVDDVKLYRAVSPAEFDGALSSQTFSLSEGAMEGKWFATTIDDAKMWANKLPDNSQILEVGIDGSALSKAYYDPFLDDIGPAYFFRNIDDINNAIRCIKGVWS